MSNRNRFLPPALDRRAAVQPLKPKIWVYCEGKVTEPDYLNAFAAEHGNRRLEVLPIGAVGVPMTIVETAIAHIRGDEGERLEEHDQVWVAFDRDEHLRVEEAITAARSAGVRVAFSNPCFELWAIIHLIDFAAVMGRHELQRELKRYMPSYDHERGAALDYALMRAGFTDACRRADRFVSRREEEDACFGNPFTTVQALMNAIADLGDPERKKAQEKAAIIRSSHGRKKR